MKKPALLIEGLVVLIAGFILSVVGLAMLDGDYTALEVETSYAVIDFGGESKTVERTFAPDKLDRVDINCVSTDVDLGYSPDGQIHVTAPEDALNEITYENGILTVSVSKKMSFKLFQINFSGGSGGITILIPRSNLPDLTVSAVSGDIELDVDALGRVELETVSGDVELGRLTCGALTIKTVSGDVSGALPGGPEDYTRKISTVSGDRNISTGGSGPIRLTIDTVSGDIRLELTGK